MNLFVLMTASASLVAVMTVTLVLLAKRSSPQPEAPQVLNDSRRAANPGIALLRILSTLLLAGGCIGIIWFGIDTWRGNMAPDQMWEWLGKAGLAEALAMVVLQKTKS